MNISHLTLRGAIKAATASGALLGAFLSVPAYAGHFGGAPPGPGFSQTGQTCVLNRAGAGDCVIVGTVGVQTFEGYAAPLKDSWETQFQGIVTGAMLPTLVDSGALPTAAEAFTSSPGEQMDSVTITGTSHVSVLGFGCANDSTAFGGSDPCYIDLAVTPGAVVANILQGELSYTFSTESLGTGAFVTTGTGQTMIASQVSNASLASEQIYWAGATVVDAGPVTGGHLFEVFSNTITNLGYYNSALTSTGTYSVDPPLSTYLTPEVGGTFTGPDVNGSNGNRVGDSGVLNGVLFPGMSTPAPSVPEPASWALFGFGALLAAALGRKRARAFITA